MSAIEWLFLGWMILISIYLRITDRCATLEFEHARMQLASISRRINDLKENKDGEQ